MPVESLERRALLAVAVWIGEVRLIDNAIVDAARPRGSPPGVGDDAQACCAQRSIAPP